MASKKKPTEGEQANKSRQQSAARQGEKLRKTSRQKDVYKLTSHVRGMQIEAQDDLHDRKNNPRYRKVKKIVRTKEGKDFSRTYYVDKEEENAGPELDEVFHSTHKDLGLQQRPRNAPATGPQTKTSEPLSSQGGTRPAPPGGVSRIAQRDMTSSVQVREFVAIQAAQIDRQLVNDIPDPKLRHKMAADLSIERVRADYPNVNLGKVSVPSIASAIDTPKIRQLTDLETGLAHPKGESSIAKSLKEREQGVRDTYRETKKTHRRGQQTVAKDAKGKTVPYHAGGVGKPTSNKESGETTKGHSKVSRARSLQEGQDVPKGKMTTMKFLNSLSPEEYQWVNQQMEYGGAFYGARGNQVPGAYRRLQRYTNARQVDQGEKYSAPISKTGETDKDHPTWKWLMEDNRGRKPDSSTNRNRPYKEKTDEMIRERYTGGVTKKSGTKASDRYKGSYGTMEDSGIGIRVPGIPTTAQLKEENPDANDRQIFEMRESAKQSVDEMLQNSRMAHETRQNTILGRDKSETSAGKEDRVVFFTTSTGYPAISVGANSLLGQYIIKKRKKMVYDNRMAPRAQLKGEFPYAVRDQHLVEVATGLTVGAQGRYGAFKHVGYRTGSHASKGYGKMLPVGSQILRDSSGQPLYDRNGNLRYTEGFTRPFDVRPTNEVGLRVYLG